MLSVHLQDGSNAKELGWEGRQYEIEAGELLYRPGKEIRASNNVYFIF